MAAEVPRDHNEKNVRKPGAKAVRPRDAATLILYRRSSKSIEVVMGERHAKHSFMPNNWSFPAAASNRWTGASAVQTTCSRMSQNTWARPQQRRAFAPWPLPQSVKRMKRPA